MGFRNDKTYIGHLDQLFGLREFRLSGGRGDGVRAVEVDSGAGLVATILPDRGMDFYQVRFMGKNTNYISPCGIVAPERSRGFLDSFFAGFLTTCGMNNIGSACVDEGEHLPMHGSLTLTPASELNVHTEMTDAGPVAVVRGQMRQATLFGSCISLTRTISIRYGESKISFADVVYNDGNKAEPLMLLYHFNIGYPLLSEHAKLNIPSKNVKGYNSHAQEHVGSWRELTPPAYPYPERCYYHDIERLPDGRAEVGVINEAVGTGLTIRYNRDLLDNFVQWKMLGKGEYAMGLEPCNGTIGGRASARQDGSLKFISAGEHKVYEFEIEFNSV